MVKLLYVSVLVAVIPLSSLAQRIDQSVIAVSGGIASGTNLILEWTLGEPVIETGFTASSIYTQGFNQPKVGKTYSIKVVQAESINKVSVAPNPFGNSFVVYFDNIPDEKAVLTVFDGGGRVIKRFSSLPNRSMYIDMSSYASGIYYLKIVDKAGQSATYSVIKQK